MRHQRSPSQRMPEAGLFPDDEELLLRLTARPDPPPEANLGGGPGA